MRGEDVGADDEVATSSSSSEQTSKREMFKCVCKDSGEFLPRVRGFTRTNAKVSLMDGEEGGRESASKAVSTTDDLSRLLSPSRDVPVLRPPDLSFLVLRKSTAPQDLNLSS